MNAILPIHKGDRATDEERAVFLRRCGLGVALIAYAIQRPAAWVHRQVSGVPLDPVLENRFRRPRQKPSDVLPLPESPSLRRRLRDLAKRGWDVPPSKRKDFELMGRKHFTVDERKQALGLE